MSKELFQLKSAYAPAGDQPQAIEDLYKGFVASNRDQTLLGVTGSGKTFTAANIIAKLGKPTLVIAHNKTLAAQLAQEYKEFFPENAVHYFVSYYDFYQPEAYLPVTDTYIEKEAQINEEIDRLRHASTQALLSRKDVIIVATVSCIYGLGSPVEYEKVHMKLAPGMQIDRTSLIRKFIDIHYTRTTADLNPGVFRALGNSIEIMPVNERILLRIDFKENTIHTLTTYDPISMEVREADIKLFYLFPAKHFITAPGQLGIALTGIEEELLKRLDELDGQGKILERERLKRRTKYDLALIREIGYCNGIENYSRHFSGKLPGEPPDTLLSYFPKTKEGKADFLTIIDESHVTVPQLNGMFAGDASRKQNLVEHGFRLPSAKDNRPLKFAEFRERVGATLYTSATPGAFEKSESSLVAEQVIRPTGLVDPEIIVHPVRQLGKYIGQVGHFIRESTEVIEGGGRVIGTTLTKKMAEDLSEFLKEKGIKAEYLHSGIKTIERIQILTEFRKGIFDCLIGVNLLREGLDLPEVEFIGILDADKEGFLRSETSLIQTIGRAARNVKGKVFLYADIMTGSMERAIGETKRRRTLQREYNSAHGITPKTIIKNIRDITEGLASEHDKAVGALLRVEAVEYTKSPAKWLRKKQREMSNAVKNLDFETAALIRDEIRGAEKISSAIIRKKK